MTKFVPRVISKGMAAEGYNNAGRGKLIGYIAVPEKHEKKCRYRVSGDTCNCRIGLWQDVKPATKRARKRAK